MINKILLSTLLVSGLAVSSVTAQVDNNPDCKYASLARHKDIRKFYLGGSADGAIFSTATIRHEAVTYDPSGNSIPETNTMGILRFTYFVNLGVTFNFNLSPHLGIYTGVDVKNIGYIEQDNGTTTKRRSYNVGAPLGIKIGNMHDNGTYFMFGGGIDFPFNFQEKMFQTRDNKKRINEWFSNRTPNTMPYLFAGFTFNHHISAKVQYYPTNFLNEGYRNEAGVQIYDGTEVHLILFSVGFGMMHMDMHHKHKSHCGNNPPQM
jgi:hypothetical protein